MMTICNSLFELKVHYGVFECDMSDWLTEYVHSCKRGIARICCYGTGRAVIDRYLLPAEPTAANPPRAAAAGEWDRDGQTDRRTLYRYMDPAPHTTPAVPMRAVTMKRNVKPGVETINFSTRTVLAMTDLGRGMPPIS